MCKKKNYTEVRKQLSKWVISKDIQYLTCILSEKSKRPLQRAKLGCYVSIQKTLSLINLCITCKATNLRCCFSIEHFKFYFSFFYHLNKHSTLYPIIAFCFQIFYQRFSIPWLSFWSYIIII